MVTIKELATQTRFQGTPTHKIAEPQQVRTLPVIDNSVPTQSNITTSVDCYVSGQYVQRKNGHIIEVRQRYTIFLSYAKSTQVQTMAEVRKRILSDFEAKYGDQFNVSNVFIPQIPMPADEVVQEVGKGKAAPVEFYQGSGLFREMTRFEKARYEINTQKEISGTNIRSIKKRYGVKR